MEERSPGDVQKNGKVPTCPKCSSTESKEAPAEKKETIVIVRDRICLQCGHRYAPPMPASAPYLLLFGGILSLLIGVGLLTMGYIAPEMNADIVAKLGMSLPFLLMGVVLFGWGLVLVLRGPDAPEKPKRKRRRRTLPSRSDFRPPKEP